MVGSRGSKKVSSSGLIATDSWVKAELLILTLILLAMLLSFAVG